MSAGLAMTRPERLMMGSSLGRAQRMVLTAGGLGCLRPFPGSWGSIPTVLLAALMLGAGLGSVHWPDETLPRWDPLLWSIYHGVLLTVAVFFTLSCAVLGDRAEAYWNRKDPPQVVADEVAGMCFPLMFLPATSLATLWGATMTLTGCFLAFRACDIVKPYPCRDMQFIPGGWGIVIDDLIAGVYAMLIIQFVTRVIA